jgi:hypothetical protein
MAAFWKIDRQKCVGLSHSLFHMHNNSLSIITLQNEIG